FYIFAYRNKIAALKSFGQMKLIENISSSSRNKQKIKITLIALSIMFLIITLARPQLGTKLVEMKQQGADIVLVVDVSTSMLAEDSKSGTFGQATKKPNRLESAKMLLFDLIQNLSGNRIGIIAFAGTSFWQCPLTLDISSVNLFLDIMDANLIPLPGTAIGDAIRLAAKGLEKTAPKSKAIVLITDGEDHKSNPVDAAEKAAEQGIKIYTIGFGNPNGEPIPIQDEKGDFIGYKKDNKGEVVMSKLDENLLREISEITGGKYLKAERGRVNMSMLLDGIKGLNKQELSSFKNREYEDRFQYPLFLVFILLVIEFLLKETKNSLNFHTDSHRGGVQGVIFLIVLCMSLPVHAGTPGKIKSGNKLFKKGEYDKSLEKYREAEISDPENPAVHYNLGNALYKNNEFEESHNEYKKAAQIEDKNVRAKVLYNLGNSAYRQGKFDEALKYYKEALKLDPNDEDAKYNYEYTKNQKLIMKKEGKKGKQNGQKKDNPDKNENHQGEKPENEKEDKQNQSQQQGQQDKDKMSKEDAERILQYFDETDRNSAEKRKMKMPQIPKVEQDW
ncbi:MAG: tetratricopeptide repeat protein, partial [Endomicrobiales bacterium]|nr:tetratricopeptide repeat protein [Endomicrobiales bacterium]